MWGAMAVVTLPGKSHIAPRVGISPHAFIGGRLQGTQTPTFRRGAEAPIDLGRQHQPHPVRVSTAQDKRCVRFANCKLRS